MLQHSLKRGVGVYFSTTCSRLLEHMGRVQDDVKSVEAAPAALAGDVETTGLPGKLIYK